MAARRIYCRRGSDAVRVWRNCSGLHGLVDDKTAWAMRIVGWREGDETR